MPLEMNIYEQALLNITHITLINCVEIEMPKWQKHTKRWKRNNELGTTGSRKKKEEINYENICYVLYISSLSSCNLTSFT